MNSIGVYEIYQYQILGTQKISKVHNIYIPIKSIRYQVIGFF